MEQVAFDLIVTVVNRGSADLVIDASRSAGAEGGTILFGRGTGIHEHARLFGIRIEPEKEVILTLIPSDQAEVVLKAIVDGAGLDRPGAGIAFVLPVSAIAGINHPASPNPDR